MIDLHCHILPGVDDGPESLETAVEMCRMAAEDGVHTIVATPHMLNGMYDVSPQDVFQGVEALSGELDRLGIALRILPGSDVHVHRDLPDLLSAGDVVTVANRGQHLLVELPQDVFPQETADLLFRLQLKGVTPILTHPERHGAIQEDPALLRKLIQGGSLTQITANSLEGTFGSRVRRCALDLLRRDMIHVVASDAHNTSRRTPRLSAARKIVREESGEAVARLLFEERPSCIVEGGYIEAPDPQEASAAVEEKKTVAFWKRLVSRR